MIVLFRPPQMHDDDYLFWAHCWRAFGEKQSEQITVLPWNAYEVARAWDLINETHGRYVIWARPEFVPCVSMFEELDYLHKQGVLVVSQFQYKCAFTQGHDTPVLWRERGIDGALVVFQLAGQDKIVLPSARSEDIWRWLGEERKCCYQVPQRYSGGNRRGVWASRSILGETIYSILTETPPGLPFSRARQLEEWKAALLSWQVWLKSPVPGGV